MKKICLLLSCAAVAMSASAFNFTITGKTLKTELPSRQAKSATEMAAITAKPLDSSAMRKIGNARKADSSTSIEGTWVFQLGDYYFDESIGSYTANFEATLLEEGLVFFEDPTNYELPMVALYDEDTSSLMFFRATIGQTTQYYITQQPYIYNWDTKKLDFQDWITAAFNAAAGTLTFTTDSGLAYIACTDSEGLNQVGYYNIVDLEGATKVGGEGEGEGDDWAVVGTATLTDPWVLPGFVADQWAEGWQWDVTLEQKKDNSGLYRLVDPYKGDSPAASINESTTKGYITFDVSDPDHVLFLPTEAGFKCTAAGIPAFYCMNKLGLYYEIYKDSFEPADIVSVLGDAIPYTTFKNGVVSLSSETIDGELEYDANFGISAAKPYGFTWTDEDNQTVNMTGQIVFNLNQEGGDTNGVAGMEVEAVAPRYFNLQGVELVNPKAGEVVIKVEGSKASKLIAK